MKTKWFVVTCDTCGLHKAGGNTAVNRERDAHNLALFGHLASVTIEETPNGEMPLARDLMDLNA